MRTAGGKRAASFPACFADGPHHRPAGRRPGGRGAAGAGGGRALRPVPGAAGPAQAQGPGGGAGLPLLGGGDSRPLRLRPGRGGRRGAAVPAGGPLRRGGALFPAGEPLAAEDRIRRRRFLRLLMEDCNAPGRRPQSGLQKNEKISQKHLPLLEKMVYNNGDTQRAGGCKAGGGARRRCRE